jgi:phosphatidylglycerophosphate synthase
MEQDIKSLKELFRHASPKAKLVNYITLYRVITAPILLVLGLAGEMEIFKWMLLASFSTDALDGFLARRYKVSSTLGAKLDSLGDDLTIMASLAILYKENPLFFFEEGPFILVLLVLFFVQLGLSFMRYKKPSSFHTWFAKFAALLQGLFMLSFFFQGEVNYPLFYAACIVTALELVEEIVLVMMLTEWKTNVKGLFWVLRGRKRDLNRPR